MSDQDWTPVTFTKKAKNPKSVPSTASGLAEAKAAGHVVAERKETSNRSAHAPTGNLRKLEESTDVFTHNTVNRTLAQSIAQARQAKKLTQAQLATAINERPQVIAQYESGQAIPNPQILGKLDRALGIHLPRK